MKDRSDGIGSTKSLHEFVGDVAHFEAWHNEHVGFTCDVAVWCFLCSHAWHECCVGLQFAVDMEFRVELVGQTGCFHHFIYHFVLGTAFGRETEHGHTWVGKSSHAASRLCGAYCNLCQLCGIGHRGHGHVADNEHTVFTILWCLGQHKHCAAHTCDAWSALDDLECGAQGVTRGAERSRYLSVGISALDDEASEVEWVEYLLVCLLYGHAFLLAELVEQLCVLFGLLRCCRVDDCSSVDVCESEFLCLSEYVVRVAYENYVGYVVGKAAVGRRECAFLERFGKHDALLVAASAIDDLFD